RQMEQRYLPMCVRLSSPVSAGLCEVLFLGNFPVNKLPFGVRELIHFAGLIRIRRGALLINCDSFFLLSKKEQHVSPDPPLIVWQFGGLLFEFFEQSLSSAGQVGKHNSPHHYI